jgi:hypothetical protein
MKPIVRGIAGVAVLALLMQVDVRPTHAFPVVLDQFVNTQVSSSTGRGCPTIERTEFSRQAIAQTLELEEPASLLLWVCRPGILAFRHS